MSDKKPPTGPQPFPDKFVGDAEDWEFMGDNVSMTGKSTGEGPPPSPAATQDRKAQPKRK